MNGERYDRRLKKKIKTEFDDDQVPLIVIIGGEGVQFRAATGNIYEFTLEQINERDSSDYFGKEER